MFKKILCLTLLVLSANCIFADITENPLYTREKVGIMVIDVQNYYIPGAKDVDINETIDRIGQVMKLAGDYKLPYYMTFEYATWRPPEEHEDHIAIHPQLVPLVPQVNSESYLKVTFDASRQPELDKDLTVSGIKKIVMAGAETDVCVIQTALGFKRRGYDVYVVQDAVYTSEANERPTFLRMAQSGIKLISTNHLKRVIENNEPLTADLDGYVNVTRPEDPAIIDPNHTGIVLNNFTQAALNECVNPTMNPMYDRAKIMMGEADAYKTPVYSVTDSKYTTGIPEMFMTPVKLEEYTYNGNSVVSSITNLGDRLADKGIYQVFVAGVYTNEELRITVTELLNMGLEVYIIQDLIFSKDYFILSQIESLYQQGAIPITEKMCRYGYMKSVSYYDVYSKKNTDDLYNNYWIHKIPWVDMIDPVEYN